MAIRLKNLESARDTNKSFVFKDIKLDFVEKNRSSGQGLFQKANKSDIDSSIDEGAIRNSIINLFNTRRGEKILNPEYGLGLADLLFEKISEERAEDIGNIILQGLERFEPRVEVINININTDEDAGLYTVTLLLHVHALKETVNLSGDLTSTGFAFV